MVVMVIADQVLCEKEELILNIEWIKASFLEEANACFIHHSYQHDKNLVFIVYNDYFLLIMLNHSNAY